jgi:YegS/Rv2252/BmrU family lipid kinase
VALIVNEHAGRGRVARQVPEIADALRAHDIESTILPTRGPLDAVRLARQAADERFSTVVAVGGDGTVNEVANGLMAAPGDRPRLGVVAAGSGCDFAKTFGLPKRFDGSLRGIIGPTVSVDVGRIECQGPDGSVVRHFVNVAEAGMAAATASLAARLPRWVGRARYLVAFWPTLATYRPTTITVTVAGEVHRGVAHNALVANGRYFGGGMLISPHSDPGDGLFDVQVSTGPKRQALTLIPRIYRGKHLPNLRIVQFAGDRVTIDSDSPIPVEADGEPVGSTPATFTVVAGALDVVTAS